MSKVQTARDLVPHKTFTKPDTTTGLTRKSTTEMEWVFGATGGHEFMIKFDKNFVKKHLFLYSKKTDQVAAIAKKLWEDAGKPPNRDAEFWLAAELSKFTQKLTKTLEARAEKELCSCGHLLDDHTCDVCNHERKRHLTGGGAPCACKEPPLGSCACTGVGVSFTCRNGTCMCSGFGDTVGTYAAKRVTSGKNDNPLAGAGTTKNTCLVLDRIPMDHFKTVVISAIQAAETNAYTWPLDHPTVTTAVIPGGYHGPAAKEITLDFGGTCANCVVKADLSQDPSGWVTKKGVKVMLAKYGVAPTGRGGNQYQYSVYHLTGDV